MCDVTKGLKSLEEKSSGNIRQLAFLYPPVGRDLGSGIFSFGRQCVHWSHCLCSKEYPQKVPSPPYGRRGLRLTKCRGVGGEGGGKEPLSKGVYNLRRTAEILVSLTVLGPPWILLRFSRYITGFFYGDFLLTSYCFSADVDALSSSESSLGQATSKLFQAWLSS